MGPPQMRNGDPGHHNPEAAATRKIEAAAKLLHPHGSPRHRQDQLVVVGSFVAPAGRRTLPAAMAICPTCRALTMHRPVRRGITDSRTGTCGHQYLLMVEQPFYGGDHDDTDKWADRDGTVYRGEQAWRAAS